jgi:hypothetical protein
MHKYMSISMLQPATIAHFPHDHFQNFKKITKLDANLDQYHVEASLETSYLIKHRTFV